MNQQIDHYVKAEEEWIIQQRRHFHMYPEPSRREVETAKYVATCLREIGLQVETGYYKTGVVGLIEGSHPGATVGIRFDMDALEMDELNDVPYKSKNPGVMHACGHDAHTAMGLGVAKVLWRMKEHIHGRVKLIFQPAEEDAPNGGGAQHMIKEGVLSNPDVDCVIGMHVWPDVPVGKVGSKEGVMMAASDPFTIEIVGRGAHASMPYEGIDPILIGAQIVNTIQSIVSRNVDPFEQAVISIGVFNGGSRYNVIPEKVTLQGTVRTFSDDVRTMVYNRLKKIVEQTAEAYGGKGTLDYRKTYPPLVNSESVVACVAASVKEMIGDEAYITLSRPAPGGEDFAYFSKSLPSAFMFLGTGVEGKDNYPPHNPHFDIDESALAIGTKVFVKTALTLGRTFKSGGNS